MTSTRDEAKKSREAEFVELLLQVPEGERAAVIEELGRIAEAHEEARAESDTETIAV